MYLAFGLGVLTGVLGTYGCLLLALWYPEDRSEGQSEW